MKDRFNMAFFAKFGANDQHSFLDDDLFVTQ